MIKLSQGIIYDPLHAPQSRVGDIYLENGQIVAAPIQINTPLEQFDLSGKIVMAGAIDLHSHIAGAAVNLARLLLPKGKVPKLAPLPTTWDTGQCYAEMGYTCAFEPAIIPHNARHAHLEMQDIPIIDTGGYLVLGNEDYLLSLIARAASPQQLQDYVAWMLAATQTYAVKVVNAGGIDAFKFNQRNLQLDEAHSHYGITPRQVLCNLANAVHSLKLPHALHIHASNLGVAGNVNSTLATLDALEGLPAHLTHLQFHSYEATGEYGFASGAARLAEKINQMPEISVDVGQVMFGQTVTLSADTPRQAAMQGFAHPKQPQFLCDAHGQAGCGIMPFRYKHHSFVHALQWAIGLELFLLIKNPWQICLSTDHPNGAPFSSYPHLIRLLMDRSFRNDCLQQLPPAVQQYSQLASLTREYSFMEIAIISRAGVAKTLGLSNRGHLGVGALADVVVYESHQNPEVLFSRPLYVFKNGKLVVRDGKVIDSPCGGVQTIAPEFDPQIERYLTPYWTDFHAQALQGFKIHADELSLDGQRSIYQQAGRD
ncbi:MAG: hypothetical protein RIS84_504 [Pseudomonadota bacterium]|jgi:formylmethanofuran dehydrogenase subunit A